MSIWEGLSNESVKERHGMRRRGSGVGCGVVEWVKRSTLRWFGHTERMGNEGFVKKVYLSSVEDMNKRGRSLGRWEDRVKEFVSEREVRGKGLEWAKKGSSTLIGRGGDPSPWPPPWGTLLGGARHQSC